MASTAPSSRTRSLACARQRGFSFIEALVVVTVVAIAVLTISRRRVQNQGVVTQAANTTVARAQLTITRAQLANFGVAVTQYKLIRKRLPDTLEQLAETSDRSPFPIVESIPLDAWGAGYEYELLGRTAYRITSRGPDGELGTKDDLVFPPQQEEAGIPEADEFPERGD